MNKYPLPNNEGGKTLYMIDYIYCRDQEKVVHSNLSSPTILAIVAVFVGLPP